MKAALKDKDSLYYFYKDLIKLRKEHDVVINGRFKMVDINNPHVFQYERENDKEKMVVVASFSNKERRFKKWKELANKDLVILVSPGASEGLPSEKIVKKAHQAGSKVCLITESRSIAKNAEADLTIILPGVHQATDMFIMQLFLSVTDMAYREKYLE